MQITDIILESKVVMVKKTKKILQTILLYVAMGQLNLWMGLIIRARPDWNPRQWSNQELRKLATFFTGDIINVGAWKDQDKEGELYETYFCNGRSYLKANYKGEDGISGLSNEIFLDLSVPLQDDFGKFDLVFSHTVLEHVYPLSIAFDNICNLSRDNVLIVVPFIQCFHGRDGSYGDYSRFTPMLLDELFRERGFEIVYLNWNEDFPIMNVYIIVLASRNPERLKSLVSNKRAVVGKVGPGMKFSDFLWGVEKSLWRKLGEFIGSNVRV